MSPFAFKGASKDARDDLICLIKGPDRLCVRLAINLRIFHLLAAREARPISAEELASLCGAEHLFIGQWYQSWPESNEK